MRLPKVLCCWFLAATGSLVASGQAVTSTHSGVVNFSEGSAFLDDQPLDQKFGTFPTMKEGSVLRTEKGRVEVLLTPGVFLRIDDQSSIRLVSNSLAKTQVEFLKGAAILDSNDAPTSDAVTLTYQKFQIHFLKPGVFRLDSEPGTFETYTGEATISCDGLSPQVVDESHQFFFGIAMGTKKYGDGTVDDFSEWARNRAETLAADNQAANQSMPPDPGDSGNGGSPFSIPVPSSPSFGVPSYGTFGGPVLVDNGFYGAYGPMYNAPFFYPPTVIYVFPRWYRRNPNPVGGSPVRSTGIPRLPPLRTGYPLPSPYRPTTPIGLRTGVVAPIRSTPVTIGRPRVATPMVSRPVLVAPIHR